jgi:hypothetical protein
MKTIKTTIFALMILASNVFSQKDSVYIQKSVDDMSEKSTYYPSTDVVLSNEGKTKGIRLSVFIDEKDGELSVGNLSLKMIGIGSCVEKNEMIIMFEDSSKITLTSWNKFNCKGDAWFDITNDEADKLATLKVKKIKITNGYTFDSFTKAMSRPDYFRQIFYAIKMKKIKEVKE